MTTQPVNLGAAIGRSIVRLIGVLIFLLCVDGCLYRDPYIELPHGYGIGSISNSTPCSLEYGQDDDRSYSPWFAIKSPAVETDELAMPRHVLMNSETDEYLEFESESRWREAIRERNVEPSQSWFPNVENIRQFNIRKHIVYGNCESGFFVLNIEDNDVRVLPDRTAWSIEVARLTGEPPGWMWNANSFFLKYRDPGYLVVVGGLTLLCLTVIYRRRNTPIGRRKS